MKRPYELHTNQELKLMLAGSKPLAAFLLLADEDESLSLSGQPFARYVKSERIIRQEIMINLGGRDCCQLLFALPDETWRFKAHDLMMRLCQTQGWNDTLERMQGTLLGYEDWQNDWHMANRDHYLKYQN